MSCNVEVYKPYPLLLRLGQGKPISRWPLGLVQAAACRSTAASQQPHSVVWVEEARVPDKRHSTYLFAAF